MGNLRSNKRKLARVNNAVLVKDNAGRAMAANNKKLSRKRMDSRCKKIQSAVFSFWDKFRWAA